MFYIYVLQSRKTLELYVGFSQKPKERLLVHNAGRNYSTKIGRPWKMIYLEGYSHKKTQLAVRYS